MQSPQEHVIAVVGAGPRGTSFLERLLSHLERITADAARTRPLRLIIIDPAPHGPGRVWDPEQSPLFLMNTPASFPTAAPTAATCAQLPASSAAMSYAEWRRSAPGRRSAADAETAPGQNLGGEGDDNDYPARADYGRYLAALHQGVVEELDALEGVTVDSRRASATGLRPRRGTYEITLDDGTWLSAHAAVLSLGHVPARLNESAARIAVVAEELGLHYVPPSVPTDVDLDVIPAGEPVLIRGMGLNFFDLMIGFTAGRGGVFTHDPGAPAGRRMTYTPSGREPHLIAGARRGTPYRAKSVARGFVPDGVELVHFTDEAVADVVARHETVEFAAHLWPLLQRDVLRTYYRTLARVSPELFQTDAEDFLVEFDALLRTSRGGEQVLNAQGRRMLSHHAPDALWFDVRAMARPFADTIFDSSAQYQQQLQAYLEDDAHSSVAGAASPVKMAVGALHAGRLKLKSLISEHVISDASLVSDVEGWFEALVEGLASGPPVQRIEELAALSRAGVVEFLGPDPNFEIARESGTFTAESPWVDADPVHARWLLEAMMPANRVQLSDSPLVAGLLSDGYARPREILDAVGAPRAGKGFDVTEQPYRLIDARGEVLDGVYVLGLQLSSVQWGTAIAAESGGAVEDTARTLADADAAASRILTQARLSEFLQRSCPNSLRITH